MPVTFATWGSQSTNSSFSTTIASTVLPSGNYLVVSWIGNAAHTSASISDSAGGSWTTAITFNNTGTATQTWFRTTVGTGSAFSVTVTAAGGSTGNQQAIGTRYAGATGSISSSTVATGTSAWPTLTTPSATSSDDLYYCHAANIYSSSAAYPPTYTAGANWTLNGVVTSTTFGARAQTTQRRSATGAGTVTATISSTAGGASLTQTKLSSFVIYGVVTENYVGWGAPI